jgi:SAM-dependent methyltransferase
MKSLNALLLPDNNEVIDSKIESDNNIDFTLFTNSPQFIGFTDVEEQELIYKLASYGINFSTCNSVIDLGCGIGDFYHYIKSVHNYTGKYIGVDINPLTIKVGNYKYSAENLDFRNLNYYNADLPSAEYVFCVNNLTIPYGHHSGTDLDQLNDLINIAYNIATVGCVFTFYNNSEIYENYIQFNIENVINILNKNNITKYAVDNTTDMIITKLIILK